MAEQNRLDKPAKAEALSRKYNELFAILLVLGLGLIPRLVFTYVFPTQPISDFSAIINFGIRLTQDPFAIGYGGWSFLNPGLPLILSALFRLIPAEPTAIARWASVIMAGVLPLIPLLVWKNVFTLRARLFSAILLALWPGQIIFSSVVAQDNWVLLPTLLLCALAVRVMVQKSTGHPFLAAFLYGLALAIRQEMLIILLPVVIIAALGTNSKKIIRNFLIAASMIAIFIAALVTQRGIATGKYSLSTSHFAAAMLGSYVPGAGLAWIDPKPYVAAIAPELLKNEDEYQAQSLRLVLNEISRRPVFFLIRWPSLVLADMILNFDKNLVYWSMTAPGALPQENQDLANHFVYQLVPFFVYLSALAHILFIAAVIFSFFNRQLLWVVAPLLLVILFKLGLHALIVSQSRFYLTTIAVEFLVIGIAVNGGMLDFTRKWFTVSLLSAGTLGFVLLFMGTNSGMAYIIRHDEVPQYNYQFPLRIGPYKVDCQMKQGRLLSFYSGINGASISMDFLDANPKPRAKSLVECAGRADSASTLQVFIKDSYTNGGAQGKIQQVFSLDGNEIFAHDIAENAQNIVVKSTPNGSLVFVFELRALDPDKNGGWGRSAATEIQFTPVQP